MKRVRWFHGQSLVEYGFIGSLVLLASLGALLMMGGNLDALLQNLKQDLTFNINAAGSSAANSNAPNGVQIADGPGQIIPPPGAGETRICSESGWCINVPDTEGIHLTGTSGALGGELTQSMANVIQQIAQQLAQDPNTDPALLDLVTQLANNGHTIGDEEIRLATNCPAGSYCGSYEYIDVVAHNTIPIAEATATFNNTYQALQSYLAANPGALPMEMQNVISFEVSEINSISGSFSNHYDTNWNQIDGNIYLFNPPNGGELTHQSANNICGSGGNTSQCIQMP